MWLKGNKGSLLSWALPWEYKALCGFLALGRRKSFFSTLFLPGWLLHGHHLTSSKAHSSLSATCSHQDWLQLGNGLRSFYQRQLSLATWTPSMELMSCYRKLLVTLALSSLSLYSDSFSLGPFPRAPAPTQAGRVRGASGQATLDSISGSQILCLSYRLPGDLPDGSVVKNPPAGGMASIPGLGRSPGEGNGNPVQYSFPGNAKNKGAWRATVHGVSEELDMT